jgi:predicted RNA-binding Zn ribbon-like protein
MVSTENAPHGLDLVIDFVNTLDIEEARDDLATPAGLAAWLAERGLTRSSHRRTETERGQALELREALRALMLAHNSGPAADDAARLLERVARRGDLGVHFPAADSVELAPARANFDGTLARLLVPVAGAVSDGTWLRVKACRASGCGWAFYDRSRNRSGVWCEMAVCGNRTKVRAYRARTPRR